jgi:small subunit ribosomal protein S2
MLFVIDTNKEEIAVEEANKLGIPVAAVVDSNCDPRRIRFPFPGNDDASRAINLYCDVVVAAVLDGIQAEMTASGVDVGAMSDLGTEIEPLEEIEPLPAAAGSETGAAAPTEISAAAPAETGAAAPA